MQLDIVIPLYKSEQTIEALIMRINEWNEVRKSTFQIHVIFVEDGGLDATFSSLIDLKSKATFSIEAIRLSRNFGQHSAISVGLSCTTGDFVVVMDDDLQHDPFDIDLLFEKLNSSNADLVYGTFKEKQHHLVRNFASRNLKRITKSNSIDLSNVTSFKIMRKSVLSMIKQVQSTVILVDVYLLQSAGKVDVCEVTHQKRYAGKSSYSNWKLIKMTLSIVLFHSSFPLRMIVNLGFVISVFCFCMSVYYIYQKLMHDAAMGFTSIIVAIFFSTGLILISLGIIGEYIRRIWVQQNNLNRVLVAEHIQ